MPIIKLDNETWPIPEAVGDYIDGLIDENYSLVRKLNAITKIARTWLNSEHNTTGAELSRLAMNLIENLAEGCEELTSG